MANEFPEEVPFCSRFSSLELGPSLYLGQASRAKIHVEGRTYLAGRPKRRTTKALRGAHRDRRSGRLFLRGELHAALIDQVAIAFGYLFSITARIRRQSS